MDSACKDCKKKARRDRYANAKTHQASEALSTEALDSLNPTRENQPQHSYIEPEQGDKFWCKKYGRELTEEEQREIRFNLLSLVQALKDAAEDI